MNSFFRTLVYLCVVSNFMLLPNYVLAQEEKYGTFVVSSTSDCELVFDGESLGRLNANEKKKIKAGFGEHLLMAQYNNSEVLKKQIVVEKQGEIVVKLLLPKSANSVTTKKSAENSDENDKNISKDAAAELYVKELDKPSPVDIGKLKFYLSKGVDIFKTGKHGWALIHEAAFLGDTELIAYCLSRGLSVDAMVVYSNGISTPLNIAEDNKHDIAARYLRTKNATYGIKDGYTEIKYDSGNVYKGNFKDGKREGHGVFYSIFGNVYDGEWSQNVFSGRGTLMYSMGDKCEGEFKHWQLNGMGTIFYGKNSSRNGDRFVGHFRNDTMSGYGVYYYANGGRYEGNYENDKRNGKGTMWYKDSSKYEGNFKDDLRSGEGTLYSKSGSKYTGGWKKNLRNGYGTIYFVNGSKFEGNFIEDNMEGEGTFYSSGGDKFSGAFKANVPNGKVLVSFANGDKYEGEVKDGLKDGKGTYTYVDGSVYEGQFEQGEMDGYGEYYMGKNNPNSIDNCTGCRIYKGNWAKGKKSGNGRCFDAAGKIIFEGIFMEDKPLQR